MNPGHRYEAVQIAGEWGEYIRFQEGPLPTGVLPANTSEEGVVLGTVNGWTNEAMLSLLIDRTLKLNSRNHNQENVTAVRFLSKALEAFSALEKRVRKQLPE